MLPGILVEFRSRTCIRIFDFLVGSKLDACPVDLRSDPQSWRGFVTISIVKYSNTRFVNLANYH